MKLPWTCSDCGASNYHYGGCRATPDCLEKTNTRNRMLQLIDLARELDPSVPPAARLEGCIVTITLSLAGAQVRWAVSHLGEGLSRTAAPEARPNKEPVPQHYIGRTEVNHMLTQVGCWHVGSQIALESVEAVNYAVERGWG